MQQRSANNTKMRNANILASFHTALRTQLGGEFENKIAPFIEPARSEFSRCGCAVITANRLLKKLPAELRNNIETTRLAMCAAFEAAQEAAELSQVS